jgi:hypothetical protein
MKKLFLLILILLSAKIYSQKNLSNYELGYFFDINTQLIDGFYDIDYIPKPPFKVSYIIGKNFTPGYYYNLAHEKITGLLKYSNRNSYFKFKKDRGDKEIAVKPDQCEGYVIGTDSFAVIQNFNVQGPIGEFRCSSRQYAEVIGSFDEITFYKHTEVGSSSDVITYLVKNGPNAEYQSFSRKPRDFNKLAVQIFGEFEPLRTQILIYDYTIDDLPTLIKILHYKRKFDRGEKIFYNSSWDEVQDIQKAAYYCTINSVQDSIFHLSYFFTSGIPMYEGNFVSFYPHKKIGEFRWYYPNGRIRKKVLYENYLRENTVTYFKDGKIHYQSKYVDKVPVYTSILNSNGDELLDQKGNGSEKFYDSIRNREITIEYRRRKIVESYYLDNTGKRMYLLCGKNAKNRSLNKSLESGANYPTSAVINNVHGIVLAKCIIDSLGVLSDIQILKGLDPTCDSFVLSYFRTNFSRRWRPAKMEGTKVAQELIIPIDFSILPFSRDIDNNYYFQKEYHNNGMWNNSNYGNRMWTNPNQFRPPPPKPPNVRYTFPTTPMVPNYGH